MRYYEVELGDSYHIYTKYTVIANSEEEAIKKARSQQAHSNLTHHLFSKLEDDHPLEFVSIYSQGPLTEGVYVEKLEKTKPYSQVTANE